MIFSKYRQSKALVIKMLLAVLLLALPLSAAEEGFRWYDDDDYKPYIYKDEKGEAKGIFKEIMEEIFHRLKIPLSCELFPWKRTQELVHNGLADGMVTVATPKRLETMLASKPLLSSGEKVFVRKDHPRIEEIKKIRTFDDLKKFTVVEVSGDGWAEGHFKGWPNVVWAPKVSSALYMIANGRVDLYVINEFSGMASIRTMLQKPSPFQENFKKIITGPHTLETITYSLLINKTSKWAGLIPRINATLDAIKRDGTYDKILSKYLSIDTP